MNTEIEIMTENVGVLCRIRMLSFWKCFLSKRASLLVITRLCAGGKRGRENLKVEFALCKSYELDNLSKVGTRYSKVLLGCLRKAARALQGVIWWSFDAVQ